MKFIFFRNPEIQSIRVAFHVPLDELDGRPTGDTRACAAE